MLHLCCMNFYWMKFNEAVFPLEATNHLAWIHFCVNAFAMELHEKAENSSSFRQHQKKKQLFCYSAQNNHVSFWNKSASSEQHSRLNPLFRCIWNGNGSGVFALSMQLRFINKQINHFSFTQLAIHCISFYYRYRSVARFTRQQLKKGIWNRVDTWHFRQAKRTQR